MSLILCDIGKYLGGVPVIERISFNCRAGTITAIVGPSGCGKTTLLNIVAGLDSAGSGTATGCSTAVGYMMQDSLLLPWRTLEHNAMLGAEVSTLGASRTASLRGYLEDFGLWNEREKYPDAASGGMRQRVALIRTLLLEPELLLLDEPFASLDFEMKVRVQRTLLAHLLYRRTTVLWVTHDIEDAIAMSSRVVVLSDKPTIVKAIFDIDLGDKAADPVQARKSPRFREYFADISDRLRYLNDYASI
jgi:NitT/TauT family transport system ATP-binding protein